MAKKKLTIEELFDTQMAEIRQSMQPKPAPSLPQLNANILTRLRQAAQANRPLPKGRMLYKFPEFPTEFGELGPPVKYPSERGIPPEGLKPSRKVWYSATGEPEPAGENVPLEALKTRLVELRMKSRVSLAALSPSELAEIDYIEKEMRKAGITYIGKPPPSRKQVNMPARHAQKGEMRLKLPEV